MTAINATAEFYVLLQPEFYDGGKRRLKRVKASDLRQTRPDPNTNGLWIKISIHIPEQLFDQIIPHLQAQMRGDQIEAILAKTSDLYMQIVGVDDEEEDDAG